MLLHWFFHITFPLGLVNCLRYFEGFFDKMAVIGNRLTYHSQRPDTNDRVVARDIPKW